MPGALFVQPWRPLLEQGVIAPGAKVYFTQSGTTTAIPVYSDAALTTLRTNPVQADSMGRVPATYLDTDTYDYRVRIYAKQATVGTSPPLEEFDPYVPGAFAEALNPLSNVTAAGIDLSALADSATPAADMEAEVNSLPAIRGDTFLLPSGDINFERSPVFNRTIHIKGKGNSAHWNSPTAGTRCNFPPGSNGFEFTHTVLPLGSGAQRSTISDLTINQDTGLATTGTASYNTASPGIFTLSAAGDFQDGQIVALEGAGPALTITGKTGQMTAGSNVLIVTFPFGHNNGVYIGQVVDVAGAGLPAGTYVTGYDGSGHVLLSNPAATNAGPGAQLTYYYPLVGKIISGGGTTTLHIDRPSASNTNSVVNGMLRHRDTGCYATATLNLERVTFEGQWGICLFRRGDSGANGNSDLGGSRFCEFGNAGWAGILYQGDDAQINVEVQPNLAGPEIGACDCSLLGNEIYGAHMAFNTGLVAAIPGSPLKVFGGYFEQGTTYNGNGASFMFGTYLAGNGQGFAVIEPYNGGFRMPLAETAGRTLTVGGLESTGDAYLRSGLSVLGVPGFPYVATPFPDAGPKLILGADVNRGYFQSYDDLTATWKPLRIQSGDVEYYRAGTLVMNWTSNGIDLASGKVLKVNGTQVVGAQGAAVADASGGATVDTEARAAINALLARLRAHGLIAP